ncbi:MAG TPA: rod shape-determining protein MreC [Spongiibacteraceae bacterium]|nr:rod shape-determining protein MreC [Spongiibacteraceae bacterium]
MKPLFQKGPSVGSRILILCVLAFALIFGRAQWPWLRDFESRFSVLATPFYWLADLPYRLVSWSGHTLRDWSSLQKENVELRQRELILQAKVEKMASLSAENARLRQLLNSSAHLDDSVLIAELIGVSSDPLRHIVIINKGRDAGAYVGQAVIDARGLVGQIIEVSAYFSRVMLITDSTHAVPVQVNRNGVRAIAEGTGMIDELTLVHVASTMDIRVGDLLVTSGLGGHFPSGYPVAVVTEVDTSANDFMKVKARPSALLDQSRYLLLIFRERGALPEYPEVGNEAGPVK